VPARFALDTSCIVAAVCTWHQQHDAAAAAIDAHLAAGDKVAVAGAALVESYAVLTRLPAPHRLAPSDAWALLDANFISAAEVVALEGEEYVALVREAVSQGIAGGRTYDAVIAACARKAGAGELLTLNRRHFDQLSGGIPVIDPAG
jgi:predicted nucleic acid-binding protein